MNDGWLYLLGGLAGGAALVGVGVAATRPEVRRRRLDAEEDARFEAIRAIAGPIHYRGELLSDGADDEDAVVDPTRGVRQADENLIGWAERQLRDPRLQQMQEPMEGPGSLLAHSLPRGSDEGLLYVARRTSASTPFGRAVRAEIARRAI